MVFGIYEVVPSVADICVVGLFPYVSQQANYSNVSDANDFVTSAYKHAGEETLPAG